jgi:hypothetical protein
MRLPLNPIFSHLNPVYPSILHYCMIHFNYILPSATKYPKLSLSVGYPTNILKYFSTLPLFHKKQRHLQAYLTKSRLQVSQQQIILKVMMISATWLETTMWASKENHISPAIDKFLISKVHSQVTENRSRALPLQCA